MEARKVGISHKLEYTYEGTCLIKKLSDIDFLVQLHKDGTEFSIMIN